MPTLRRTPFEAALLSIALVGPPAWGADLEVLAHGLDRPTAVVVAPGPDGGVRLVVAEADRLTQLIVLGDAVLNRSPLAETAELPVVGLAPYEGRLLLLSPSGLGAVADGTDAAPKPPTGPAVIGPPAWNGRWLYAPGEQGLLRCQLAGGRFTPLAAIAGAPTARAIAFAPQGYLTALVAADAGLRLVFFDPERLGEPVAGYPLAGIRDATALTYSVTSESGIHRLYVVGGRESPGLFRIDLAIRDGEVLGAAAPIAGVEEPSAIAAGPDGELFLTTRDGRLLRFREP